MNRYIKTLAAVLTLGLLIAACGTGPHPWITDSFASGCKVQQYHTPENNLQAVEFRLNQTPDANGCAAMNGIGFWIREADSAGNAQERFLGQWITQDGDFGITASANPGTTIVDSWITGYYNGTYFDCRYHGTDTGPFCAASVPA